jgi:hypothetical protein
MDDSARARLQAFGDLLGALGRSASEAGAAMTAEDAGESADRWNRVAKLLELTATATDQMAMETEAQRPSTTGYSPVDALFLGQFLTMLNAIGEAIDSIGRLALVDPPQRKARWWREAAAQFRAAAASAGRVAGIVQRSDDTFGPGGRRV